MQNVTKIFGADYPEVVFLGAGNTNDIQNDPRGVIPLLTALAPSVHVTRVIDRDDQMEEEIHKQQAKGIRVLSRRTIESYLLDDAVLQKLCEGLGNRSLATELLKAKQEAISNSVANGGAKDDLKRAAGDIYIGAKRLFPDEKLGSDKRAFMKALCAPRVPQVTPVYTELRRDIFGE